MEFNCRRCDNLWPYRQSTGARGGRARCGSPAASALPANIHWRVYLEMADLMKRENRFPQARQLYRKPPPAFK